MTKTYILAFLFSMMAGAIPAFADIEVKISDQSGVVGDTIKVGIESASDFSGENVTAWQFEVSYNATYFEPVSATLDETVSESWGNLQVNMSEPGIIKLISAGAEALSGTGTLVYISFRLLRHGNLSLSFTNTGFNVLNEGIPELILSNGSIGISQKPYITVSPNTGKIAVGKSMQFNGSGGEGPYQFSVSNTEVASISNSGMLTGLKRGMVHVIAKDQNGVIDSTNNMIEIVPFELTIRDTTYFQDQSVTIPVNISSMDVEAVTSGQISVRFNNNILYAESLLTEGAILAQADNVETNTGEEGKVRLSFAASEPLSGSGPLFFIRFKIANQASGSTNIIPEDALFNQNAEALYYSGTFSIQALPDLEVTPKTATLLAGEELNLGVSGGTPPYTWSVSDTQWGSINENGELTAISGGDFTVTATDAMGANESTEIISVYDGELIVDHVEGLEDGTPVLVPVNVNPVHLMDAITSFSGNIPVNPAKIETIQINQENTASRTWASASNTVDDVFKFAMAGTTASASAPENPALVFIECMIHPDVPDEEVIPVKINQALINEGNPRLLISNGSIKVNVPTFQESEEDNEFRVFPNPANEMLHFSGDLEILQVKIIDLSGRTLMMKEYQGTVTEDKIPIDNLSNGLYMVWFKTPGSVNLQKLVIRQ